MSEFKLVDSFTAEYKYEMEGKVTEIQSELQKLRDRLEDYLNKFPNK